MRGNHNFAKFLKWLSLHTLFEETMQMSSRMDNGCIASVIVWHGRSSESLESLTDNSLSPSKT